LTLYAKKLQFFLVQFYPQNSEDMNLKCQHIVNHVLYKNAQTTASEYHC